MPQLRHFSDWPALRSEIATDPGIESAARSILEQMTLDEKVGQMIQPDLVELTAEDVRDFRIGSALNGAGRWPGNERRASASDWASTVDTFWQASEEAYRDRPFRIPFMWASDAVHGHNNVHGATIFPHNIGLGATRDTDLIRRIGAATAREIAATGIDWTFAPTVTVPRDRRWGRHYEGYSEDPEVVYAYAREMVKGLQGDADRLKSDTQVLACVKHWVGDGGTFEGEDRGIARCSEDELRNVHAVGFFSGIQAGAQSVMVSYSGWHGDGHQETRLHGSAYLLTEVLKERMAFDGIVIGDWDAHPYVDGCSEGDAGAVVAAGVDILMISTREKWQSIYRALVEQVRSGNLPMSRIDDAVLRILRVKMRAGLWEKARPSERTLAGDQSVLGCPEHRELAREAVRKSLVLLKNDGGVLPLSRSARVLLVGSAADAVQKQAGGYTVTWQGDDVTLDDFPGGSTLATAVGALVGSGHCTVDPYLEHADPNEYDAVLVAVGEDPYAEMFGAIRPWRSLEYAALKPAYARDLQTLRRVREAAPGAKVVTVMFSGRPLYTTEEINLSDAFVAAWLPGPQAEGITDLLFAAAPGGPVHDFEGRLAFDWPRSKRAMNPSRVPPHLPADGSVGVGVGEEPLFAFGYGLTLRGDGDRADLGALPLDPADGELQAPPAIGPVTELWPAADRPYAFHSSATANGPQLIPLTGPLKAPFIEAEPIDRLGPADALSLTFHDRRTFVYAHAEEGGAVDFSGYLDRGGRLELQIRVVRPPAGPFHLTCHDNYPHDPSLDIGDRLRALPVEEWTPFSLPLSELAAIGVEFDHVDVPFMIWTEGPAQIDISAVRLVRG